MPKLPQEFIQRMKTQLGSEAEAFFLSLDQPSPTSIRLHHLRGKASFDLSHKVPWCDTGYYLPTRPFFYLDPHWHGGAYYVQEASSMILDYILNEVASVQKPRIWLDLCAAPGGKTGILAKHMGPADVLVANEVVSQRRNILRENLVKAGYLNTFISGEPAVSFKRPLADIILVDAPCAGEGMMRKDDEAIRQWNPSLVHSCSLMQKQIVQDAANALKSDGYLIYSTCSYSMEENIENISHFIRTHNLQPVPVSFPEAWGICEIKNGEALGYQLYPHKVNGEGLFIAVLKKDSSVEAFHGREKKPFKSFVETPEWLSAYLPPDASLLVRKNNEFYELLTAAAEANANEVVMHLPGARLVIEAGELKGKDFVPAHTLAMSGLARDAFPGIEVDLHRALDYLERSIQTLPQVISNGWHVIYFEGTPLGWAKNTPQGWKNHYPMHWRLRDRHKK